MGERERTGGRENRETASPELNHPLSPLGEEVSRRGMVEVSRRDNGRLGDSEGERTGEREGCSADQIILCTSQFASSTHKEFETA
jgi:hypothetical protein